MDLRKLTNASMMTAMAVVMTLIGVYIPPLFVLFFLAQKNYILLQSFYQ